MKELIGKKFRYKSKYGGLSDWEDVITDIFPFHEVLCGPPKKVFNILIYPKKRINEIECITSSKGIPYRLDEIEIID